MGNLISVLIVDDNAAFCNVVSDYLNECVDMNVKGKARNGIEAIEMIKELKPDIVILDLIMPNLDGIGVLERISEMNLDYKPIFIVLSGIGKDVFIQKAMELGAEYYILKPFDADMLILRIRQLYNERAGASLTGANMALSADSVVLKTEVESPVLERLVSGIIKSIGIQPNVTGYRYLREAVILSVENMPSGIPPAKSIYHSIADRYKTTSRNVARAISCAIASGYKKMYNVKGSTKSMFFDFKAKPTNIQVIAALVEKARLKINTWKNDK